MAGEEAVEEFLRLLGADVETAGEPGTAAFTVARLEPGEMPEGRIPAFAPVSKMYSFALYSCTFFHVTVNSNPDATPFTLPNTPPIMGVASNTNFLPTLRLYPAHSDPVRWAS